MRLDTGCDAALEWWLAGRISGGRMTRSVSQAYRPSHQYFRQLGRQYFNAVSTGIHGKPIFPGEAGLLGNELLSKFRLTIDQPGNRVIFENPL